jgi:hypothetical protein
MGREAMALAMVARAELRRQWGVVLLGAVIVALISGAVMTAGAGARQTATVLDRYLDEYEIPDLAIGVSLPRWTADADSVRALEAELAGVRGVDDVVPIHNIHVAFPFDTEFALATGPDDRYLESGFFVLEGRMPSADSVGEVALNEAATQVLDMGIGDELVAPTISPATAQVLSNGGLDEFVADGPELRLEVVGVFRDSSSFEADDIPAGVASPDVGSFTDVAGAFETLFLLRGDPDTLDSAAAITTVSSALPDAWVYSSTPQVTTEPVATAFDSIAAGLALFAVVSLIAGLIALGQLTSRQVAQSASIVPVLRGLGVRDRDIALTAAAPCALIVGFGVVGGAVLAVALSPRFPISLARQAETDPGVRIDWPVRVGVSALFVIAISAWALGTAIAQVRRAGTDVRTVRSARFVGLHRALPVTGRIGSGWVLGARRGRAGIRPGSAILGAVLGVAGILAITVFTLSQSATAGDPARYGWNWDSQPDLYEDPTPIADALTQDPRVASVGTAFCDTAVLDGAVTSLCALDVISGGLSLTYLDGRAPGSPDEAAVGQRTLETHHLAIGDTIEVTGESGTTATVEVVGTVVQPDATAPGEGLVLTAEGFVALADSEFTQFLLLEYAPDADRIAVEAALAADFPFDFDDPDAHPAPPRLLSQLEHVRPTLFALAVFLGFLGAVGLVHFLFLSVNRRQHDTAALKAMGLVGRQASSVVTWQALTVALLGVVVGVPLGVIVGRWVWIASVDQIGIVDSPTTPWLVGALVVAGALLGAIVLSIVPGSVAARRSPGEALRRE